MESRKLVLAKRTILALAAGLIVAFAGCGPSNSNEAEFLSSAPPGEQTKPEGYAERRARTHTLSKQEQKNQAAAQKAAEKAAAEKAAKAQ